MEWIRFSEQRPPLLEDVLITDGSKITLAFLNLSGCWDSFNWFTGWADERVTHWMPLPPPPQNLHEPATVRE